jgi:hypothetical protein
MTDPNPTYVVRWEGSARRVPAELAADDTILRSALLADIPGVGDAVIRRAEKPDENGVIFIDVEPMLGSKGRGEPLIRVKPCGKREGGHAALQKCPEGRNPMIAMYLYLRGSDLNHLSLEEQMALHARIQQALADGQEERNELMSAIQCLEAVPPTEPRGTIPEGF